MTRPTIESLLRQAQDLDAGKQSSSQELQDGLSATFPNVERKALEQGAATRSSWRGFLDATIFGCVQTLPPTDRDRVLAEYGMAVRKADWRIVSRKVPAWIANQPGVCTEAAGDAVLALIRWFERGGSDLKHPHGFRLKVMLRSVFKRNKRAASETQPSGDSYSADLAAPPPSTIPPEVKNLLANRFEEGSVERNCWVRVANHESVVQIARELGLSNYKVDRILKERVFPVVQEYLADMGYGTE